MEKPITSGIDMRVLSRISVYGKKLQINNFLSEAKLLNWKIEQVGSHRKVPEIDYWCALSEGYEFDFNSLGNELLEFLSVNEWIKKGFSFAFRGAPDKGFLTIFVTDREEGEDLSTIFDSKLLSKIVELGLELEISHENIMPNLPLWRERIRSS